MDSDPLTCVFATTTRDHPIHLWDSSSGEVLIFFLHGICPFLLTLTLLLSLFINLNLEKECSCALSYWFSLLSLSYSVYSGYLYLNITMAASMHVPGL